MKGSIKIGVVGACGTGKSELVFRLIKHGYEAHHIAQEHSFTPHMWQAITNPDVLIYLQVSFDVSHQRKDYKLTLDEYNEQIKRLNHAEAHADLKINTDELTPDDVFKIVLSNIMD